MKKEWEAFFGQIFPLAEGVHNSPGAFTAQFSPVEEFGRQCEQRLVRAIVVDQLSYLL